MNLFLPVVFREYIQCFAVFFFFFKQKIGICGEVRLVKIFVNFNSIYTFWCYSSVFILCNIWRKRFKCDDYYLFRIDGLWRSERNEKKGLKFRRKTDLCRQGVTSILCIAIGVLQVQRNAPCTSFNIPPGDQHFSTHLGKWTPQGNVFASGEKINYSVKFKESHQATILLKITLYYKVHFK